MQKSLEIIICNKFIYCLVFIMLSSCEAPVSPGSAALAKFSNSFSQEVEKNFGLQTVASGVSFPKKINWIHLSFSSRNSISIEEGRRLAVLIANLFIQRMNEDENLKQYLANNPASLTNVDLTLGFKDDVQNPINAIMITGSRNLVTYNIHNDEYTMLIDLHRETFDEAERIVQQESASKLNTYKK